MGETRKTIKTTCTLDCWDSCSMLAEVENGELISLKGDPRNPVTGAALCEKGYNHLKMRTHSERLTTPLIRKEGVLVESSWDEALDLVASKLDTLRKDYPATALMHITSAGNTGIIKRLDQRFFNAFGGVTTAVGSLCAGAGNEAQRFDFGRCLHHEPTDLMNSRMIILWGRNPVATGQHMVPWIKKAKEKGAYLVVIDPLHTETTRLADLHLMPRPGTDGALALAIANIIDNEGLLDMEFIKNNTLGFDEFRKIYDGFDPGRASQITGIDEDQIIDLAKAYGTNKPASIILGFGIQRYSNGGDTVRAIDALGAITGNIGRKGGGVSYNNHVTDHVFNKAPLTAPQLAVHKRTYKIARLAEEINTLNDPPIRFIYTARANPITQNMDTEKVVKAFESVDFKLTLDMFLTDTAKLSDVVLPVNHFLEEDNIVMPPSNHSYINYCNKTVEPPRGVKSELEILNELAVRLAIAEFPIKTAEEWLEEAMLPLKVKYGIDIEILKEAPFKVPEVLDIPWSDKSFHTPSGKYEFYSHTAKKEGFSPIAEYREITAKRSEEYPFYLLTPHLRGSLHSQQYVLMGEDHTPTVYMNDSNAQRLGIEDKELVHVSTEKGKIEARLSIDTNIPEDRVKIYEGWWLQRNGGINRLVPEVICQMGLLAAYYEVVCKVEKIRV